MWQVVVCVSISIDIDGFVYQWRNCYLYCIVNKVCFGIGFKGISKGEWSIRGI